MFLPRNSYDTFFVPPKLFTFTNYRPITGTPVVSLLTEAIILNKILQIANQIFTNYFVILSQQSINPATASQDVSYFLYGIFIKISRSKELASLKVNKAILHLDIFKTIMSTSTWNYCYIEHFMCFDKIKEMRYISCFVIKYKLLINYFIRRVLFCSLTKSSSLSCRRDIHH